MKNNFKKRIAIISATLLMIIMAIVGIKFFHKWSDGELDKKSIDLSDQENTNMDNLLIMCLVPDFPEGFGRPVSDNMGEMTGIQTGNFRLCYLFRNGSIYCANEYYTTYNKVYFSTYDDDMWEHFHDIHKIGEISSDQIQMLCSYVDQIEITNPDRSMYKKIHAEVKGDNINIFVFRPDFPERHIEICSMAYKNGYVGPDNGSMQEGYYCLNDDNAQKVTEWILEAGFRDDWKKHIRETGQELDVEYQAIKREYNPGFHVE